MYKLFILFLLISVQLYAKGTSAGTVINNIATLDFTIDDTKEQIQSNVASDTVAQLIDLHIDALDTGDIKIKRGVITPPLSFQITNTGNGADSFEISYFLEASSDFEVRDIVLHVDSNNNKIYDNDDQAVDLIALNADENRLFFIVAQTLSDPKISKQQNQCIISVKGRSNIGGSGERGKVHYSKGIKGVDAVDGEDGGIAETKGTWSYISLKSLFIKQQSSVVNQFGNSEPVSGAIITYNMDISTPTKVTAKNVIFKNPIPKNTEYQKNSLKLNSKALTDRKDRDIGYYDSKNNLIKVDIGCVLASKSQQVQFKVKIK